MKYVLRLSVVLVFTVATLFGGIAYAQTENDTILENSEQGVNGGSGFRVSPTRDDFTAERGTVVTRTVEIRNVTENEQTARAVIDDFSASANESGAPNLLIGDDAQENYPYSIKPFVLSIEDVLLQPGQKEDVLVTFSIPEDTAPGSYFGLLRFVTLNELDEDLVQDIGIALNASVGVVFLIQVPGDTVDLLSLEEISVVKDGSSGSLFSSAPDTVAIRLNNTGNTFQAPFGRVLVKNWSGDIVYEYELNDSDPRGNVLPDSIRRFENEIEGIGSFGRYTVESNISYGDGGNIITGTVTFWVVPWNTIGLAILAILIVGFAGTRGLKAYNKRVIESSKGTRVKKK